MPKVLIADKLSPAAVEIFQRRGVESSLNFVPVHPGLAKYMREKGNWDAKWDARIAKK